MARHSTPDVRVLSGAEVTDEELTELALSADLDQTLDPDATPFATCDVPATLLPAWYMPAPVTQVHRAWHRPVVAVLVSAFLLINGLGLCITYGYLVVA